MAAEQSRGGNAYHATVDVSPVESIKDFALCGGNHGGKVGWPLTWGIEAKVSGGSWLLRASMTQTVGKRAGEGQKLATG